MAVLGCSVKAVEMKDVRTPAKKSELRAKRKKRANRRILLPAHHHEEEETKTIERKLII
jgi:hypothetical protein